MAEVFISYARASYDVAARMARALRDEGYLIWFDEDLPLHRPYHEVIEERLHAAKAVIVVWSAEAAKSQWVRAEADLARQAAKLVQVSTEPMVPPMPFNQIHCEDLSGWNGATDTRSWRKLVANVDELVQRANVANPPAPDPGVRPIASGPGRKPPRLSLVVMPFANMSRDAEQEYFADGVTETLTTDLSRLSGSFVIARNTAFSYKGKTVDAREVGESLNVRYVLEGSVQRSGERLRISVQLIDVASGAHIWADRFDKPIADLFEMQDEIVTRLARALDAQLIAAEARRAAGAVDADSMDLYFMGQAVVNGGFSPPAFRESRVLFQRALQADPHNVEALAAQAQFDALAIALAFTADGDEASYADAEALALRAVRLAPNHPLAHHSLGQVYSFTDRVEAGLAEYRRALSLDRNFAHAYAGFAAASMYGGNAEASEQHILRAFELSPHDHQGHLWCLIAGTAKIFIGEAEAAEAWFRRGIEINPAYPIQMLYLAGTLVALGRLDEAGAAGAEALRMNPRFSLALVRSIRRSKRPRYLEQLGRFLELLREAGIPES